MFIVSVIVLYNPDVLILRRLVDGLLDQVSRILLIDNGSKNFSDVCTCFHNFEKLDIIPLGENFGIAKAHNVGIEAAKKMDASHVLIFDQDSYAPPELVEELVVAETNLLLAKKNVAAVGPAFYDSRTKNNYPFSLIDGFFLRKIYSKSADEPVRTSFLISSGSLIRISVLDVVGFMKEDFFIDYVDIEWGLRAAFRGFESFGIPKAIMEHSVGDERLNFFGREISVHSPLRRYYLARNGVFMMKLPYVPWRYRVRELMYSVSRAFVFICLVGDKFEYLKYISKGWWHGLLGKSGKYKP